MRSSRGLGSVGANSSTHSVPWGNVAIPDLIMEKERKKEMYNEGSTPRIGTSRSTKALGTGVALVGLKVVWELNFAKRLLKSLLHPDPLNSI